MFLVGNKDLISPSKTSVMLPFGMCLLVSRHLISAGSSCAGQDLLEKHLETCCVLETQNPRNLFFDQRAEIQFVSRV